MHKLTKAELFKLANSFISLGQSNREKLEAEFRYVKAIIPIEQETDFFLMTSEINLKYSEELLKQEVLFNQETLEYRENNKHILNNLKLKSKLAAILNDLSSPIDDRNLRSSIHFIEKQLQH